MFRLVSGFFNIPYSVFRHGLISNISQSFPHFSDCIGIHIFFNLIDDCPAVHISYFRFALIHVDKTYKTENADYKPYVEASAGVCLRFFRIFIEILIYSAVSGMNGRDILSLFIKLPGLPQQLPSAVFRIIHRKITIEILFVLFYEPDFRVMSICGQESIS